jgi:chromosome segregation ATPase
MKRIRTSQLAVLTALAAVSFSAMPALSDTMTAKQKTDPDATKAANLDAVRSINGDAKGDAKAHGDNKAQSAAHKEAVETADRVNKMPGGKIQAKDLEADTPEIKGFHPIKKILQPVENLEGMSVKLEQQIMKLEGPISALQPPMINLQHKMTSVDDSMAKMQSQLKNVQTQMGGVRDDLKTMRGEISELKGPILSIQKPLEGVSSPLEALQRQLDLVLLSIFIASVGVVIGTPIAAVLIYRYRTKLFPAKTASALPKPSSEKETEKKEPALR